MGKTTPILRMTFLRARRNDLLGVRTRPEQISSHRAKSTLESQNMSTCRTKLSDRTRLHRADLPESRASAASGAEMGQGRLIRLLRLTQVMDMTGLGRTKIYALQAEGNFPMRVQITPYRVGWIEHEVQAWIATRIAARTSLPAGAQHQSGKRFSPERHR
jgi:prophage regulatory protein